MHTLSSDPKQPIFQPSDVKTPLSFLGHLPHVERLGFRKYLPFSWLHHKEWMYLSLVSDELFVGLAIVDLSYSVQAFVFVYHYETQKPLVDLSQLGPPGAGSVHETPTGNREAIFDFGGLHISVTGTPVQNHYQVSLTGSHVRLEAKLQGTPNLPSIAAMASPGENLLHGTEKIALLEVSGLFQTHGRTWSLRHNLAGIDYTNGYLPRNMKWKWAFALGYTEAGQKIAFNLVDGALNEAECALWLENELIPLERAVFSFSPQHPEKPWYIKTLDGALQLNFESGGMHKENKNLGVVASRYLQIAGSFRGTISLPDRPMLEIKQLHGVVEDQSVKW